jgi:M6 family metalloprotease-like protein
MKLMVRAALVLVLAAAGVTSGVDARLSAAQVQTQTLDGVLSVVWGDPHPSLTTGGTVRYTLATPDGRYVGLQMNGLEGEAVLLNGKAVRITGRAATGAFAQNAEETWTVDSLQLNPTAPQGPVTNAATFGTKKVIFLLAKFPGEAAPHTPEPEPHTPTFFSDLTNPDTPVPGSLTPATINGFFKKTSWNQFSWIGDVGTTNGVSTTGAWLTLPQSRSFYNLCNGCNSQLTTLANDAMALGRAAGINFSSYDNINFVFSNDLDCCAWGGSHYASFENKVFGTTWEPPWGQETGTYAHEMGHSLGLPHSGWVYFAYDSPWDIMSNRLSTTFINCGTYISANNFGNTMRCTEPGDSYIAAARDFLGWIPTANQVTGTSATATSLEGLALPLGAGIKMLKICQTGYSCTPGVSGARYYTVEARVKALSTNSQYDNAIPNEGIIIHSVIFGRAAISGSCYFNNQSGWAVTVDSTPGDYNSSTCASIGTYPNNALNNAHFSATQTYTNASAGVNVRVGTRSGSSWAISMSGFTDDPLVAGTTTIKAVHLQELRDRINTLRVSAGLTAATFTDSTLTAGSTTVKAVHITELRARLAEVYVAQSLTAPTYTTDPTLTTATGVKAAHITELRAAILAAGG